MLHMKCLLDLVGDLSLDIARGRVQPFMAQQGVLDHGHFHVLKRYYTEGLHGPRQSTGHEQLHTGQGSILSESGWSQPLRGLVKGQEPQRGLHNHTDVDCRTPSKVRPDLVPQDFKRFGTNNIPVQLQACLQELERVRNRRTEEP